MKTASFIPSGDIPPHLPLGASLKDAYQKGEYKWFGCDNQKNYQALGGHPNYGEEDVLYRLNSYGYRCPEFSEKASLRVLSLGCSHVFGEGLPQHEIFHEQLCQRIRCKLGIPVVNFNLGVQGGTNEGIVNLLFLALPVLRPDLILVNFTHSKRRDYIDEGGRNYRFIPSVIVEKDSARKVYQHFKALISLNDDRVNMYRCYKSVEAALQGRKWLYSFSDKSSYSFVIDHIDDDKFSGCFERVDLARDHVHFGPKTHEAISNRYWKKLVKHKWFE